MDYKLSAAEELETNSLFYLGRFQNRETINIGTILWKEAVYGKYN